MSANQQAPGDTLATSSAAQQALSYWKHAQAQAEWRRKREKAGAPTSRLDAVKGRIERLRSRIAPPPPRAIPSRRDIIDVGHDIGMRVEPADPLAWIENGIAAWYAPPLPAGVIRFIRCQVTDRRDLLGRIFVINIDDPKHQFYVSPRHLRQRFKGEAAPGVFPSNPNGDDAA